MYLYNNNYCYSNSNIPIYHFVIASKEGVTVGSREYHQLQKENTQLQEENNLLKYKIELLLDMLASSNADNFVLQKELEASKKAPSKRHSKKKDKN